MYALFQQVNIDLHASLYSFEDEENLGKTATEQVAEVTKYSPETGVKGRSAQVNSGVHISSVGNS